MVGYVREHVYNHVMIDIETMGSGVDAAVFRLTAVPFNMATGDTAEPFDYNISMESEMMEGFNIDVSTVKWWMQQDEEARKTFYEAEGIHTQTVFLMFDEWLEKNQPEMLWANGASFDFAIIRNHYRKITGLKDWPYFRQENCIRSFTNMYPDIKKNAKFEGTPHNSIDDCKHQIKVLRQTMKKLGVLKESPSEDGVSEETSSDT
jgi:exodeoxyribonuclease VIII